MNDSSSPRSNLVSRQNMQPLSALAAGQPIGRFKLLEFLGEGGLGSVWLAEDPTRKDDVRDGYVVLKFLRDDIRRCPEAVEQFKSAYRKVQQLFHEHICPLLDLGDDPTFGSFQVSPFVEGMTLLELLKQEDPEKQGLPPEQVVAILQPVAKALDYAHREGLIHRDIKPSNIMVDPETGKVFVVDFGLAAEVWTSMSMHSRSTIQVSGTEPYMAPEQWLGQAQDGRSDQYSLAVVAWQMLTGRLPFQGSGMQLGFAVTNGPIPELPEPLLFLQPSLSKALAKDRTQRFSSPVEFADALSHSWEGKAAAERPSHHTADVSRAVTAVSEPSGPRPPLLVAPFDATEANAAQQAWAKHLGIFVKVTNSLGMSFRVIPPGTFDMGSLATELDGDDAHETLHKVTITQPKLMGVYPVTQGEWTTLMGSNPSDFKWVSDQDTSRFPVECVSWEDCQEFLIRLHQSHAMKGWHYRLPTEAEWEYACRAGTVTPFWFGGELNGKQANCDGNDPYETDEGPYLERPSVVGSYNANPFGLYDQHGNVWEWCEDRYGEHDRSASQDPTGATSGSTRILRGGSWYHCAHYCRSAIRGHFDPSDSDPGLGFRVLCELTTPDSVDRKHTQSKQLLQNHQYNESAETLADIPEHLRDTTLFAKVTAKRDRVKELDQAIHQAIKEVRLDGIHGKVAELLQLQPHREDLKRLLAQLPAPVSGTARATGKTSGTRPPLLVAPFDAHQAKAAQEAWARHLGIDVEVTNSIGMKLRVIPPGTFDMGSPATEPERSDNETLHKVTITQPKLLGVYPVTQGEWTKLMGRNASHFQSVSGQDTSRFPVEQVSWKAAQKFVKKLNSKHGLVGWRYRLPTEAEWEYTCRAGTVTPFWFGGELNGRQANCNGNYPYETRKGPYLERPSAQRCRELRCESIWLVRPARKR